MKQLKKLSAMSSKVLEVLKASEKEMSVKEIKEVLGTEEVCSSHLVALKNRGLITYRLDTIKVEQPTSKSVYVYEVVDKNADISNLKLTSGCQNVYQAMLKSDSKQITLAQLKEEGENCENINSSQLTSLRKKGLISGEIVKGKSNSIIKQKVTYYKFIQPTEKVISKSKSL